MKFIRYRKLERGIKLFLLITFALVITMVVINESNYKAAVKRVNDIIVADLGAYSLSIDEKISAISSDVFLLKELLMSEDIITYDNGTEFVSEDTKSSFENRLKIWLDNKNVYDQVRILDNDGQELLRVNYEVDGSFEVDDELLQNKGDRYYFQNSIDLDDNSLYLSEFDLNVENGEIEYVNGKPKQMLRLATPLVNSENQKMGVMIFNYLSEDLFDYSDNFEEFEYVDFEVVNADGFYLHALDEKTEYGFMFANKLDETFDNYHDFKLFEINENGITQSRETDEIYSAFVVSEHSLSITVTNTLGETVDVVSENGALYVFGEINLRDTEEYGSLIKGYWIFSTLIVLVAYFLSRLIDEIEHLRVKELSSLEYSSSHDQLTSLPNRTFIFEKFSQAILEERVVTALFIDFDGFKGVNDTFGHDVGDFVLIEGSHRLKECVRNGDTVSRIGGDEFLIALYDIDDRVIITRICNRIIESFALPFAMDDISCSIGVSIGIEISKPGQDVEELISNADEAMYYIKDRTKNSFAFFSDIKKDEE